MADSFGNLSAPRHAGPVRATGEGRPASPHAPTHPATVVAVTGSEDGVVHHQVRLLGRIVPLDAPAEIPVGTVLEVLALRGPEGLRAVLPDAYAGSLAIETFPLSGGAQGTSGPAAPAPRSDTAGAPAPHATAPDRVPLPDDLPLEVAARLRSEGLENAAGVRAARRLVGLGIPVRGALLRGGALVEGHSGPTIPSLGGELLASLEPLLAQQERLVSLAPGLTELPALARLLGEGILAGGQPALLDLEAGLDRLVRTIIGALDAVLGGDPRVDAARRALAELTGGSLPTAGGGTSGSRPAGEAAATALPVPHAASAEGETLSIEARRRGLDLLRNLEHRAIEEHPIAREFGRALRDVLDRSHALAYRVAVEGAERDAGFRADPDSTWFVATEDGRPVRVRRSLRRAPEEGSDTPTERRFRIETRGWGLGEIVVDGTQRERGREVVVGIELSAALPATRRALAAEIADLLGSFEGTALSVTAAVVPWRSGSPAGESESAASARPPTRDGLDRRV